MKKIIIALITGFFMNACTDGFEEGNVNPYEISDESLTQDFNHIGSYYPTMLGNLYGNQVEDNLVQESFAQHMGIPSVFAGGDNNTTYNITWNSYWDRIYGSVMAPARKVIIKAEEGGYSVFSAWATLVKILGISRLTAVHGPVIYSDYGSQFSTVNYDSEEALYSKLFSQLDEVLAVFNANTVYAGMVKFDASYGGDVNKWIKLVNSLRLRLAIRISNVAPELAKTEGEKAIADAGGLITSNDENFLISLYGSKIYLYVICHEWDDTRMGATMESFLIGLKDNRIGSFFAPVSDLSLVTDHPDWAYKGIRSGAEMIAKGDRTSFSKINLSFKTVATRRFLTAAEVSFNLAEAALRGWAESGDAKTNYENGVKLSFSDWGASGVDEYLADASSTPINYTDPVSTPVNDFISRSTVTVAWNELDNNELKLEKIITQKWINSFTDALEPWVDFRRTGYPKLPHVYKNTSNSTWGVIAADEWIKRMPFVTSERTGNSEGVANAVATMKNGDLISTRLWWDTGEPNF